MDSPVFARVLFACPKINDLVKIVSNRDGHLHSDDLQMCYDLSEQIAQRCNKSQLLEIPGLVFEQLPNVMDRVTLYVSDQLEIRIHCFVEGAQETFIHNHGTSFISTCLEGCYNHRLWMIDSETNSDHHFSFDREKGGIYRKIGNPAGQIANLVCQPFEQGQSLFLSNIALHSVEGKEKTSTIVIRDKRTRVRKTGELIPTSVLSPTETIQAPTDSIILLKSQEEIQRAKTEIMNATSNFLQYIQQKHDRKVSFPNLDLAKFLNEKFLWMEERFDSLPARVVQELTPAINRFDKRLESIDATANYAGYKLEEIHHAVLGGPQIPMELYANEHKPEIVLNVKELDAGLRWRFWILCFVIIIGNVGFILTWINFIILWHSNRFSTNLKWEPTSRVCTTAEFPNFSSYFCAFKGSTTKCSNFTELSSNCVVASDSESSLLGVSYGGLIMCFITAIAYWFQFWRLRPIQDWIQRSSFKASIPFASIYCLFPRSSIEKASIIQNFDSSLSYLVMQSFCNFAISWRQFAICVDIGYIDGMSYAAFIISLMYCVIIVTKAILSFRLFKTDTAVLDYIFAATHLRLSDATTIEMSMEYIHLICKPPPKQINPPDKSTSDTNIFVPHFIKIGAEDICLSILKQYLANPIITKYCCGILALASQSMAMKGKLIHGGITLKLIEVLKTYHSDREVVINAVKLLQSICVVPETTQILEKEGGIPLIVSVLQQYNFDQEIAEPSSQIIKTIAGNTNTHHIALEDRGVRHFLK